MKMTHSKLTQQDVEILDREEVYHGYFKMHRLRLKHRKFDGGWSGVIQRELMVRTRQVAAVLLYDPSRDQVVLLEQFRVGALEDARSPWMIELVAGVIEADETLEELAHRETFEEAGLTLLELNPICTYWVTPGCSSERVHIFCGRVDARDAGGLFGLAEEDEDIRSFVVDAEEAFKAVDHGLINNASAIIALQWLKLNKEHVF